MKTIRSGRNIFDMASWGCFYTLTSNGSVSEICILAFLCSPECPTQLFFYGVYSSRLNPNLGAAAKVDTKQEEEVGNKNMCTV